MEVTDGLDAGLGQVFAMIGSVGKSSWSPDLAPSPGVPGWGDVDRRLAGRRSIQLRVRHWGMNWVLRFGRCDRRDWCCFLGWRD